MMELKQQILEVLQPLQLSVVATLTEDGKPWARYVMTSCDDGLTVRFSTFTNARKVAQVRANPEVHITCGITDPTGMKPYLQVQGRAHFSTDPEEKSAFWNPTLEPIFSGPDDPNYGVMIVEPYRIEFCTPGSLEPQTWTA